MKARAKVISFKGEVAHRHEADELLAAPGSTALVHRGVDRAIVMTCPDGCGETLTVNLDKRTGPAWRIYNNAKGVSLFPSVWRETGCKSHFIVWQSRIYWCDWEEDLDETDEGFEQLVMSHLPMTFTSYTEIAEQIAAVPWAVLSACNHLTRKGLASAATGRERGQFKSKAKEDAP